MMTANMIRVCKPEKIRLEALPYRFPMRNACTQEAELRHLATCLAQGYPRLALGTLKQEPISIVGFGPSLRETWQEITFPCLSVSGAHDFLLDRGMVSTYYANCDGRDRQTAFLMRPHHDTHYLMATISNPQCWELLKGHRVSIWHNANGQHIVDWIGQHDDGGVLIAGGSNIGLSAIHLAGVLGYREFKIFGLDGNLDEHGVRHAGVHPDQEPQKHITRHANGLNWPTTPQLSNACDEFLWLLRDAPISVEVYGDSLLRAILTDRPPTPQVRLC